jgi:hypothetical protein
LEDCGGVFLGSTLVDQDIASNRQLKKLDDRRIEMMPIELEQSPTAGLVKNTNLDPNKTLHFIGQYTASMFFAENLNGQYKAKKHWTSLERTRAGLEIDDCCQSTASFTFASPEASKAVSEFLVEKGYIGACLWTKSAPTYHFAIAPIAGDWREPFVWSSTDFEMVMSILSRLLLKLLTKNTDAEFSTV